MYNSRKNIGKSMTRNELVKMLDFLDEKGVWCFNINIFNLFFPNEAKSVRNVSLKRHADNRTILNVCRGFYANPRARSRPSFALPRLAYLIRPREVFYISYETALSDYGIISQMPNRLTFATTGRSQIYDTPYGILEFTHSTKNPAVFLEDCTFYDDYGLYYANPRKAVKDAVRANRNVGLIDFDELDRMEKNNELAG
jgi:predicted transcriptional regulator of viral defense system